MENTDGPTDKIKIEPIEVVNMDTLLEVLDGEQERPCHNSFLDLHEPEIVDGFIYRQMQFKKYGYAINNYEKKKDDSL